jgi:hypothetical protein
MFNEKVLKPKELALNSISLPVDSQISFRHIAGHPKNHIMQRMWFGPVPQVWKRGSEYWIPIQ